MKKKKNLLIALILAIAIPTAAQAQSFAQDTVWLRKTDQDAFYMLKFSKNDSIIAAFEASITLFFDVKTGQEIKRIDGGNYGFFINNDHNFLRINKARTGIEIFDLNTWQIIDSLQPPLQNFNINTYSDVSKDEKFLIANIQIGFQVWDLTTKKILKTKIFPSEKYLQSLSVGNIKFNCDHSKIIVTVNKTFNQTTNPSNAYTVNNTVVYDFNTLDSVDVFSGYRKFFQSNDCQQIALNSFDSDSGVEVRDFTTKSLKWKFPINGYSLTGMEFSTDDKYLVTSNGPGANALTIRDLSNGTVTYDYAHGSYDDFDVSHNGSYIVSSTGGYLFLWYSRFSPVSVPPSPSSIQSVIYPNPSTGLATIQFTQTNPEITNINLSDLSGNELRPLFNQFLNVGQQKIDINTSVLANGTYLIVIQNLHLNLLFKLIVNK